MFSFREQLSMFQSSDIRSAVEHPVTKFVLAQDAVSRTLTAVNPKHLLGMEHTLNVKSRQG